MRKPTKALTTTALAGLLGVTGVAAPAMLASPGTPGAPQAAEAGSWLPQKPNRPQPVGWGDVCLVSKHYSGGRYQFTREYRWFTTSAAGSTCMLYRTYR